MSDKHGAAHTTADHDGHEAFDPEPVAEIGADETPSPAWLPIVGATLFTIAIGALFYPGASASAKPPEPPAPTVAPAAAKPAAPAKPGADGSKKPVPKRDGKGIQKGSIKKIIQPKK